MPIQRDHAAERDARIDAFLLAVRRSSEQASAMTVLAPPPEDASPIITANARLTK